MKNTKWIALIAILTAGFVVSAQDTAARILHVTVQDNVNTQNSVSINLPMGFLRSLAPMVQQHTNQVLEDENLRGKLEEKGIDLKFIWQTIRENGPTELVEVNEKDTRYVVKTTETHLVVNVDEDSGDGALIEMPIEVLDALFGDNGDLNIEALIDVLEGLENQDLFSLTSDEQDVRIWID